MLPPKKVVKLKESIPNVAPTVLNAPLCERASFPSSQDIIWPFLSLGVFIQASILICPHNPTRVVPVLIYFILSIYTQRSSIKGNTFIHIILFRYMITWRVYDVSQSQSFKK